MKYITHRRFKGNALCGEVNIPAMTEVEDIDGVITYDGKMICYDTSANAHQYFARNDDGNGMLRGGLTHAIQKCLAKRDARYQERWDKVWEDTVCQPYKRPEDENFWLWNHDFFNAEIDALKYIANLVGAKEVK